MLYGNVSARTGGATQIIDDFEGGDVSGYRGYTAYFAEQPPSGFSPKHGSNVLYGARASWTIHLYSLPSDNYLNYYPQPGDTFRVWLRTSTGNGALVSFGKATNTYDQQYEIALDMDPARVYLYRDDSSATTVLDADTSVTPQPATWYEVEVEWGETGEITVTFYHEDGTVFATLGPVTDATYTGGGIMFTAWTEAWFDHARKVA